MTVQQMIESVQQIFPQGIESQIALEIDSAQKKFCREARCLRKLGSLSNITSQAQWTVPSDFIHLYRVMFYSDTGQKKDKTDVSLDWTLQGGIVLPVLIFYSTGSAILSTIPTSVSAILVRYSYLPSDIRDRTDTFDLKEDYVEGVYAYVMESMYSKFPVVLGMSRNQEPISGIHTQMLQYWERKAGKTRLLAKKMLNIGDDTEIDVVNYDHAGRIVLPEEHQVSGGTAWT